MLVITAKARDFEGNRREVAGSWHIDEELNVPDARVITFQADGDELQYLLDLFRKDGVKVNYPAERLTPVL